jgi:hypothetical protein
MFTAAISRDLTANRAIELFGEPDKITGSGLVIYIYHLNDRRSIWLGFPGAGPIMYARLEDQDGNAVDLPLPETAPGETNADPTPAGRGARAQGADSAANEVSQASGPVQVESFELTRTIVADWGSDNAGRQMTGAVERIWYRAPVIWRIESTKAFIPEQAAPAPDVIVNDGQTLWSYKLAANHV